MTEEAELRQEDYAGRDGKPGKGGANDSDRQIVALTETIENLKRKVADQKDRIDALARGREESMAAVGKLRAELALVVSERDRLRQRLTELESLQTETLAIEDRAQSKPTRAARADPASIDELMSSFTGEGATLPASHSTMKVDSSPGKASHEFQEMISPEAMVLGSASERARASRDCCLVLLGPGNQPEFPLNEALMTIGRSESADIKVEGDFISRIHARILRIGMDTIVEDAGSRNGTLVNDAQIQRQVLADGDEIRIGSVSFRFDDIRARPD